MPTGCSWQPKDKDKDKDKDRLHEVKVIDTIIPSVSENDLVKAIEGPKNEQKGAKVDFNAHLRAQAHYNEITDTINEWHDKHLPDGKCVFCGREVKLGVCTCKKYAAELSKFKDSLNKQEAI